MEGGSIKCIVHFQKLGVFLWGEGTWIYVTGPIVHCLPKGEGAWIYVTAPIVNCLPMEGEDVNDPSAVALWSVLVYASFVDFETKL